MFENINWNPVKALFTKEHTEKDEKAAIQHLLEQEIIPISEEVDPNPSNMPKGLFRKVIYTVSFKEKYNT